jgi:radical SAM protein with 4Fe4S-binding SPASM domain
MKIIRPRAGKARQRSKDSGVRFAMEELKFLRSFYDLKVFLQNMAYLMPRVIGTIDRFERVPPSLQIEPTNHCNVSCICCPTARSSRPKGYMDLDLFRSIVDGASQIGVKRVRLFLHGEPMLHPHIVDMIAYLKSRGLAIHLTTNGVLLNPDKIEGILRSGTDSADHITFSILGDSREVYESIMRRSSADRVAENIHLFLELRRELRVNGPVIETIFYAMPENEHEEEQYVGRWRGVVDHARRGGRISESFSAYKREGLVVVPRKRTCSNLWERMTVFWNGDVTLCCQDVDGDWILGNLRERSITEIWNSERLLAIKAIHREKRFEEFPFCRDCDM